MKKTLLAMAGLSAIAIAAPAASQMNSNVDMRVDRLQTQIQMGVQQGTISRAEAQPLREQLRMLRQAERQYSRDGLTRAERRDLQNRIRTLRQQINYAERMGDTRYGASGFLDRNRDGWDDRDYDRDGRLDTYQGQGGVYEPLACRERGGIGGVIDDMLGRDDCELRIGMTAPGNLMAVPYRYRNSFRDGNGIFYRSDGDNIYQIDRRGIVTRVIDID